MRLVKDWQCVLWSSGWTAWRRWQWGSRSSCAISSSWTWGTAAWRSWTSRLSAGWRSFAATETPSPACKSAAAPSKACTPLTTVPPDVSARSLGPNSVLVSPHSLTISTLCLQSWSSWRCIQCQRIWLRWTCPGMNFSFVLCSIFFAFFCIFFFVLSNHLPLRSRRNALERVPDWLCNSSKLEVLDLNHNCVAELPVRWASNTSTCIDIVSPE